MNIEIRQYSELESTNKTAMNLAENGALEGTIVVAKEQVGGRGRLSRVWTSPKGGLWFSVILRPHVSAEYIPQLTLLAGNAVVSSLRKIARKDCIYIKWPNDVLWKDKKICGILSEASFDDKGEFEYVVIGIGLNVNLQADNFGNGLKNKATSLALEMGQEYDIGHILSYVLKEIAIRYESWKKRLTEAVIPEWRYYNCTLGRLVDVKDGETILAVGIAKQISPLGALEIESDSGMASFNFGEVSIRNHNI